MAKQKPQAEKDDAQDDEPTGIAPNLQPPAPVSDETRAAVDPACAPAVHAPSRERTSTRGLDPEIKAICQIDRVMKALAPEQRDMVTAWFGRKFCQPAPADHPLQGLLSAIFAAKAAEPRKEVCFEPQ